MVSSPRCLRSSPGTFRSAAMGTLRSTGASMASSTCARSEVWRCSSRGGLAVTTCFLTPESTTNPAPSITPPPVRIWCPASDFGGSAAISQSVTGRVWQPSRKRSCTSSCPSWRVSCMVAGDTSPERTLHRQLRQRPRAPQVASMETPAARAASSSEAPRRMCARRTAFAPSGSTKPTSILLASGSLIAFPCSCSRAALPAMSGYAFGQSDLRLPRLLRLRADRIGTAQSDTSTRSSLFVVRRPASTSPQAHASRGSSTSFSASLTACTASRPQPSAPHSSAHSWVVGAPPTRIFTLSRCPALMNSSIVTFW